MGFCLLLMMMLNASAEFVVHCAINLFIRRGQIEFNHLNEMDKRIEKKYQKSNKIAEVIERDTIVN